MGYRFLFLNEKPLGNDENQSQYHVLRVKPKLVFVED